MLSRHQITGGYSTMIVDPRNHRAVIPTCFETAQKGKLREPTIWGSFAPSARPALTRMATVRFTTPIRRVSKFERR